MKIHKSSISFYENDLELLAESIGDLRYDALSDFLKLLSTKLDNDSKADKSRSRFKLAKSLNEAAKAIEVAKIRIDESWRISEPYMNDYE